MDRTATPVIGKDVIESLTIGMYEDSKFIYREYIQNAADQIDKAEREGLLAKGDGEIHVTIKPEKNIIIIEDNATGIPQNKVVSILQNIAQSTKERGVDKGFRGIGRLGGLGYCDKLIFETTFFGERTKSILTWDATELKNIINNRNAKEEAVNVISEVTKHEFTKEEENAHYFKVTLTGVTNTELLDVKEIRNYLSMVAPVPFSNKFIFRTEIYNELKKENLTIDEYKLFINTEQLFKGYTTYIYKGDDAKKEKVGEVIGVQFFKDLDKQGNTLFFGWYSLTTSLNEQMRAVNKARGFRLRKSNIQVGNEYTLEKLHREQRGNFYYFGEVYGFHPDLLPNSRRDYFVENERYFEFEKKVRVHFYKLKDLYYAASSASSATRRIEEFETAQKEFVKKSDNQGFVDRTEQKVELDKLEKKREQAVAAQRELSKLVTKHQEDAAFNKVISKVTENKNTTIATLELPTSSNKPKFRTDNISGLNKEQRKFLAKIFSIIQNVLDEKTAKELINKIEEELR